MNKCIILFCLLVSYRTAAQTTCSATNVTQLNACFASTVSPNIISLSNNIALGATTLAIPNTNTILYTNGFDITGSTWSISGNPDMSLSRNASSTVIQVTKNGTNKFSDINTAGSLKSAFSSVLPVALTAFEGRNTEGGNVLAWQTADEKNTSDFDIERSNDAKTFDKIGTIKAKGSNANYAFTDGQTTVSTMYYRLTINDLDGKSTTSNVIAVAKGDGKGRVSLRLYPSVTSSVLTVETAEEVVFHIVNIFGQEILTGRTTQRIDVAALTQGTYVLCVGEARAKFVKQ